MSPSGKPSRELKKNAAAARRPPAVARPLKAYALLIITAAAFTQLYPHAPFARFAPASFAQKQDEQKRVEEQKLPPVQIPLPEKRRVATLVADPRLITLCPGEPARVRLATRPPARGRWYSAGGVGEIIKVDTEEGTAVWELSGTKQGTYAAAFKSEAEPLTHVPAPRLVRVTVRECTKPTPTPTPTPSPTPTPKPTPTPTRTPTPTLTPTPQENNNGASGALTPTPPETSPSPTPDTSPSPSPTPGATPPEVTGGSTPEVFASPAPTEEEAAGALSWSVVLPIVLAILAAAALLFVTAGSMLRRRRHHGGYKPHPPPFPPQSGGKAASLGDEATADDVKAQMAEGVLVGGVTRGGDEVQCSAFSPLKVSPGDSFLVQVFAHLATQVMQVVASAEAADAGAKQRDSVELDGRIERGQELVFELTMRGLEVQEPAMMRLVWNGKPKSVKFDVHVPDDCQPKSVTGTVDVYYLNVPIGNLRFRLDIVARAQAEAAAARPSFPEQKFKRYKYAFISYASEDRAEVLRRVQVLPLVAIEYFHDVTSLDPGDRWARKLYGEIDKSDVFFLFWSKAARDSEWVEKEVLYAIERKRGDEDAAPDIKPVMLEGPPPVAPPDSLRSLHFNDRMMYFISAEDSLRAARNEGTPPGDDDDGNAD